MPFFLTGKLRDLSAVSQMLFTLETESLAAFKNNKLWRFLGHT